MAVARTRILMFHRILEDTVAAHGLPCCYRIRGTALTPNEFEHVLDTAGPIVPLDAVEVALASGEDPPSGTVLTFDDGYREHLPVARVLAQRGVPAVFYIATGIHGAGNVAPVDAWYWLLDHATERTARVTLPCGGVHQGRLDTLEGKMAWVGGRPKQALLAATANQQTELIAALARSAGCWLPSDLAARLYMNRAAWSSLVRLGMRVGAHSVNHALLTQLDKASMHCEVHASVGTVKALCHPVAFAYPNGDHDEGVVALLRAACVSSAVTCESGAVMRGADVLRLPREFIRPESVVHL